MQSEFDFMDEEMSTEAFVRGQEEHWRESQQAQLEWAAHAIASEAKYWGSQLEELNELLKNYGYSMVKLNEKVMN